MKHRALFLTAFIFATLFLASFTLMGDTCRRCGGEGIIREECQFCNYGYRQCNLCYGNKEIRCTYCQGGGSFKCNWCAGRGYSGDEECSNCGGSGYVQCEQCRGTGTIACPSCGAEGHVSCSTCGGRGYTEWRCPDCGGTRVVDD